MYLKLVIKKSTWCWVSFALIRLIPCGIFIHCDHPVVCPAVLCLSSHLSVYLAFLPVRPVMCQLVCLPVCPPAPLCSYVSLSRLYACQGRYSSASLQVCLSTCLSLIYLFIVLSVSLVFSVWSEARLLSFTVKCSADWKGHFSNGAALPLIFCLSLGVRLIYHASSPADIQIHFDWRLDGMTPTTTNAANITAVLACMHKKNTHTRAVKCDILHTQSQVYSDMNMPITPTHTH